MKDLFHSFSGFFLLLVAFGFLFLPSQREAGSEEPSLFAMGVALASSVQLGISDGVNQSGKKTYLTGGNIDFGEVSFVHPELIGNGDAYLAEGRLRLEAVVSIDVVFSGASSVALQLTRLKASTNPFDKTWYSLSTNRSDTLSEIYDEPRSNLIDTVTETATRTLRMALEIKPQQEGRINDRFRLEATAL
ncbi:MAG: hypothetical protein HY541_02940 [Deltaproteobacteria bacterium]|nr:hypothetical protein [Deltaproteobacteria bacterium]